jgi:hypothetical protein
VQRALEGDIHLTRSELGVVLKRGGIIADSRRLAYIMMHAELDRLVCSGVLKGKQHTYALLDERAPRSRSLPRDEALGTLAGRFFRGHGPATLRHFAWWSELSMKDARAGLELVRSELARESADGMEWFAAEGLPVARRPSATYLVPEYDEALTGYRDLGAPDLPRAKRAGRRKDAFFRPIIFGDRRGGTWRRTVGRKEVVIETNLFAALNAGQSRALRAVAERYGRFLGMPAVLQEH